MIDKNMCEHKFTFKREDLFNVNPFFSKKRCELCGETITLERKHKVCVILYVTAMVLLLMLIPYMVKLILPGVSYLAKTLIAALLFVILYGCGLYRIMKKAAYQTYTPPKRIGEDSYEKMRKRSQHRTESFLKRRS